MRVVVVALVVSGCSGNQADPTQCSCAASAMPEGFYTTSGDPALDAILQMTRTESDELEFGLRFQFGSGSRTGYPLSATMDGCLFSGVRNFDSSSTGYEAVWSCEESRLVGTGEWLAGMGPPPDDPTFEFSLEPIETPFMFADDRYRLYGSETWHIPSPMLQDPAFYIPEDLAEIEEPHWELIGEADQSARFELATPFPVLLLTWPRSVQFDFDALVDEVTGVGLSTTFETAAPDSEGVRFRAHATDDPRDLAGPPDGVGFAGVAGHAGFIAVSFPELGSKPAIDPATGTARIRVEVIER